MIGRSSLRPGIAGMLIAIILAGSAAAAEGGAVRRLITDLRLSDSQKQRAENWLAQQRDAASGAGLLRYMRPHLSREQKNWLEHCRLGLDGECRNPECPLHGKLAHKLLKRVDVAFRDTPLVDVAAFLAAIHDLAITFSPETQDRKSAPVSLHLKGVPIEQALDLALIPLGLHYRREPQHVVIVPRPANGGRWFRPASGTLTKRMGMHVEVSFTETPLRDVLSFLAALTGDVSMATGTIGAAKALGRLVTITAKGVTLAGFLDAMLGSLDLTWRPDGNVVVILERPAAAGRTTAAPSARVREALRQGVGIVAEKASVSAIVADLQEQANVRIALQLADEDRGMRVSLKVTRLPLRLVLEQLATAMTLKSRSKAAYGHLPAGDVIHLAPRQNGRGKKP